MMTALFTMLALGIAALVFFGVILAMFGVVFTILFSTAAFLIFKVAPLLLLGWIGYRIFDRMRSPERIAAADRRWLDGE